MIDIALIRNNPEKIIESLEKRGEKTDIVEKLSSLDSDWRRQTQILEALQAERNVLAKTKQSALEHRQRLSKLKKEAESIEKKSKELQEKITAILVTLPNLVADDVPVGKDAGDNKVIETVGSIALTEGKSHEELMIDAGWLNLDSAAKGSGARFRYLIGEGANSLRNLINKAIALAQDSGFTLVIPPVISRSESLFATGFFPRGIEDTFQVNEDQYLVGTSEPMLLLLEAQQLVSKDKPKRYVGISTCFRREAGSYGKDTKGMFRMHQFEKVELVSICHPEQSVEEHELIISLQEKMVKSLGLPYQKVLLCSGDQGPSAMKQYDIETWFPSQGQYRETHSASNCGDYQARALKIKLNGEPGFAHTLNGTLVTERLLLAAVENYQDSDGKIHLPPEISNS